MRVARPKVCFGLIAILFTVVSCSDSSPTAPTSAEAAYAKAPQSQEKLRATNQADLEGMSDRELLIAVLGKLNALEARMEAETQAMFARVDSVVSRAGGVAMLAATKPKDKIRDIQVRKCRRIGKQVAQIIQYKGRAEGGGQAEIGPDAVEAEANAQAEVELEVTTMAQPKTVGKAFYEVCKDKPVTERIIAIVNAMESETGLSLDETSLDRFTQNFVTDPTFGFDRVEAMLSMLPVPSDLITMLMDPLILVQRSREVFNFAMDNRCNPDLYAGTRLADVMSEICALEDELPTIQEVAEIFNSLDGLPDLLEGLDGLPDRLASLDANLFSACQRVNTLLDAGVSIPRRQATIFAGESIGTFSLQRTFTTFPAFNPKLFPTNRPEPLSFCT